MPNSVDPDKTAHYAKSIIIAYGSERVNFYHSLGSFSRQYFDIFFLFFFPEK